VCSCFDISEPQIHEALDAITGTPDRRLAQLQQQLRCGTNCGSCKPALQVLVEQSLVAA
jgi:assimilatory nitrate reductase catalytic subunit